LNLFDYEEAMALREEVDWRILRREVSHADQGLFLNESVLAMLSQFLCG